MTQLEGMVEMSFKKDLERLINRYSMEGRSDTPDYILANFMHSCLIAFETASTDRDQWRSIDVPQETNKSDIDTRR